MNSKPFVQIALEQYKIEDKEKEKFWKDRLRISTEFCCGCVGSFIDSLVKQALLIEKYTKNGYFSFNNNSNKTSDTKGNLISEHFKGEYKTLIEYFRTTIYLEFRLIVLFFYIQNPNNQDYKSFLSKDSIGGIDMNQLVFFFNDSYYHKIIKSQIQKALSEINNSGITDESGNE